VKRLLNAPLCRRLLASRMHKTVAKKALQAHYPAPFAAIDQWRDFGVSGERAFVGEAKSITKLFESDTAKNLLRVFFLQTEMKNMATGQRPTFQHVHVVGAGTMGGDIAAWCALKGMTVSLQDRDLSCIAPAIKRAHTLFSRKLKLAHLVTAAMDRLVPDVVGDGIAKADVIIEAIYENLKAKQALFVELENKAKPQAILATNTSSIPLDEINQVLKAPERLVGIHFFNPVAKMQLVEVVQGQKTSAGVMSTAVHFVRALDRLPLPVKSKPGFLINRVLMPYLLESVLLLEEGVSETELDEVAKQFGMPMGPVTLADTVGLDVCLSVADNLVQHFGGQVPKRLRDKVEAGHLGCKSGQGFYRYVKGRALKQKGSPSSSITRDDIQDRLIYAMFNQAAQCLREGVVQSADWLDAGMIFGTGFAPFRGGPMHLMKTMGFDVVSARFDALALKYGERFNKDAYFAGAHATGRVVGVEENIS
jgi:3-hydroxyacyl-CoA dehydrogenase/enoyl-CoA hydratase/3-hydroxybutyryl-CoA epimerase